MATDVRTYVRHCEKVVQAKPKYKKGASNLKECDCIGMDKYAFREAGVRFSTPGTNYSARYQMAAFAPLTDVSQLRPGAVVFRAKHPGESGYSLRGAYQRGGARYNGDLTDYCHIGTVASVDPVRIIHMTSPTAKTDTDWRRWHYIGLWKPEYLDYIEQANPEEKTIATVSAPSGKTVNMRKSPTISSPILCRVPIGSTVEVLQSGEWARIRYNGRTGYMQSRFLDINTD